MNTSGADIDIFSTPDIYILRGHIMLKKRCSKREKLELEISQKQAQLKDLDAREKAKERKRDTRRKIIMGSIALQHAAINDDFRATIDKLINEHVTSKTDRDLFNIPPHSNRKESA